MNEEKSPINKDKPEILKPEVKKPTYVAPQLTVPNATGSRSFKWYYCKHIVEIPNNEGGRIQMVRSYFWSGIRLETNFMGQADLAEKLGFRTEEWLIANEVAITREKETKASSAARNGLIYELQFSIAPADGGAGVPPYGKLYTTTVPVSAEISLNAAANALRDTRFTFTGSPVNYVVVRGSIQQKKSKATTWRFQL